MAKETFCKIKIVPRFYYSTLVLLSFLLLAQSFNIFAQEEARFGLRSGVSIPLFGYRAQNLDDGSFAQTGFLVSGEGVYFFTKHLGAGLTGSLALHPVDVIALARARVKTFPFLSDLTIRSEPYTIITMMPAFFYKYDLTKKWSLRAILAAGLIYAKTPYQLYKPDYYLLPDTWEEKTSAQDWKFSWQPGLAINYQLSPCVNLVLNTGFMVRHMEFNFSTAEGIRTDKTEMSTIDLTLGFDIKL
jgi:hypothetical protein